MATAKQYLETAASYIGVSGTDNIFNTWIWGHHVYDPDYYPWCAAFQSYVGIHDLGMPFNASASAAGVAWQGERVNASEAQAGDWVLFNWDGRSDFGWADHIGVVEWFDHDSGYFGTIEGNTGGGEGSVMRCTRGLYNGYSTAFFRPPYDGEESGTDEKEFDMTEALIYIDDAHEGYDGGEVLYWNPAAGFCYLEHPDCIVLIKECNPDIAEIHSSKAGPWVMRAKQATNPTVAAKTYGKHN